MKKFTLVLILFVLLMVIFPKFGDAHVLQADKSIGAIMHINPDDDPAVNSQSNFFFDFKDKKSGFSIQNCTCIATIKVGDRILTTVPLTATDTQTSTSGTFSYTFPQKNVYTIILTGEPQEDSSFEKFRLTYPVRVAKDVSPPQENNDFFKSHLIYILGILIILGAFIIYVMTSKRKS